MSTKLSRGFSFRPSLEALEDRLPPAATVSPTTSVQQQLSAVFQQATTTVSADLAALTKFETTVVNQFLAAAKTFTAQVNAADQVFVSLAANSLGLTLPTAHR
jgi:hypothetical protein